MRYRREVDGLRALAVFPVVLFHAGFSALSGGFVGVDVFFVISGYLITSIILDAENAGTFSFKNFYERRARRILPALFFISLVCLLFAWFWLLPLDMQEFSQSLMAVSVYVSNVFFWKTSGYFDSAVELKPLVHTWSLGVEEQFYLFFPLLLIFLLRRVGRRSTHAVLAAFLLASLGLTVAGSIFFPNAAFFLLPSRAWELLAGSFIALALPEAFRTAPYRLRQWAGSIGLALIFLAVFFFDEHTPFPSLYTLVPVTGAVLVLSFASSETLVGRILGHRIFVGLGLISYSAYLWHQPFFAFARQRSLLEPEPWVYAILVVAAFAAAGLSWKFVEQPFRKKGTFSRQKIFTFAAVGSVFFLLVGFLGHYTKGYFFRAVYEQRFSDLKHRMRINKGLPKCEEASFKDCATSDTPEILVWGDSYAMHLVEGFLASQPAVGLAQRTMSHCGPIMDVAPINEKYGLRWAQDCVSWNDRVMQYIHDTPSIKYVVLGSRFVQYWEEGSRLVGRDGARYDAAVDVALRQTVEKLKERHVVPVVFSPPPQNGKDMGHCVMQAQMFGVSEAPCAFSEASVLAYQSRVIDFLYHVQGFAKVVWLKDGLCAQGICRSKIGDVFVYRDKGHLSYEGSVYLGRTMDFYGRVGKTIR